MENSKETCCTFVNETARQTPITWAERHLEVKKKSLYNIINEKAT